MPCTPLRRLAVCLALLVGLLAVTAPSPAAATPAPSGYAPVGSGQLLRLVNEHRRSLGLRALAVDKALAARARDWSEQMAQTGRLSHNEEMFSGPGRSALRMRTLGENVGVDASVVAQHKALLRSSGHRRNLEDPRFALAGVAVVRDAGGRLWTTQVFGVRR